MKQFRVIALGPIELCNEFAGLFGDRLMISHRLPGRSNPIDCGIEFSLSHPATKRANLAALDRRLPPAIPILTNTLVFTLAEQATWVKQPNRLLGIGALPSTLHTQMTECVRVPETPNTVIESAQKFFDILQQEISFVGDAPGLVLPRIRCMIVNEACFALGERVASKEDIDRAMRLGTNYPSGPFEWGSGVGFGNVLAILEALQRYFGEERYRPAPVLRAAALLKSWQEPGYIIDQ